MKKTLPWLALTLGIIVSTLIWDFISLPYDYNNNILGQYSANKINPLNDTLRGLSFIFIPILFYLLVYIKLENINLKLESLGKIDLRDDIRIVNYLSLILVVFSIIEFLSLDYNNFLGKLDVHHEGTSLTAQLNFFDKKKFWTGTFFDYGFLGNNLGIFSKFIFGEYTIGIHRFSKTFLVLFNKVLLILVCREISCNTNFGKNKGLFFLIFTVATLSLANFYDSITPFPYRVFIFLIFTILIFNVFSSTKVNTLVSLIGGSFSLVSMLFYWDIGTYINAILLITIIYLFLVKKNNAAYLVISGAIFSWLIFYLLVPNDEFKEFINQYFIIINISDYLLGIEYPKPFSEKSTRFTKALLLIILSGILLINFILSKINKSNQNLIFFLFYLFLSSIIFFKSGLMRSDTPHIKYSSGLYMMLLFFFISHFLTSFMTKINFKFINIFFQQKIYFLSLSIIISCIFFFQNNYLNLFNILNTNKNFLFLTKIEDQRFLDENYIKFIDIFKDLTTDESCVQQFTDDNAIPYLVNKPTCTKYYVSAHIIENWTENNFIRELTDKSPNYIVYSSKINWFKDRDNAPNADKFILDNYGLYKDLSPWKIYKKR